MTELVNAGSFKSIICTTLPSAGETNFDSMTDMKVDDTFDLISSCIDQVYSDEETWSHQECTKKELSDFVESLNSNQFKMVENLIRKNLSIFLLPFQGNHQKLPTTIKPIQ